MWYPIYRINKKTIQWNRAYIDIIDRTYNWNNRYKKGGYVIYC